MTKYFQCDLSQGASRSRAYIEERGAVVGNMIEVKEAGFTGLWRVDDVGQPGLDVTEMKDRQQRARNAFGSIDGERKAVG